MTRQDFLYKWFFYGLSLLPVWWLELFVLSPVPLLGATPMLLPLCFAAAAFAAMPPAAPQRDALACFAPGLLFIFPALILAGQVQGIIL